MTSTPTNYHESTESLRRDLLQTAVTWQQKADELRKDTAPMPSLERPPDVVLDIQMKSLATAACVMAGSYAYTLAAVIGIAKKTYGDTVGDHLAFEVDEILTNGDFDDNNADLVEGIEEPPAEDPTVS